MKKNIFILLIAFVPFFLNAQPYSNKDKALIATRVDSLLAKYMQKSSLAEIGSSKQSLKVIREFKKLFAPSAIIFDDINAEYEESTNQYPYKLSNKSVNEFFDGLIEQFSQGIIVNDRYLNINYNNVDKGEITAVLGRSISGVKSTGKYSLVNEDTLSIKMAVQPDKSILISGITAVGTNIKVINDKDLDGVVDLSDDCPDIKGKVQFKGCPDSDGDGIRDKDDECPEQAGTLNNRGCPATTFAYRYVLSLSTGIMFSQVKMDQGISVSDITKPEEAGNTSFSKTALKKNPGVTLGYNFINAQIGFYFGRKKFKKNIGVTVGVAYTQWKAIYDAGDTKYFFKGDNGDNLVNGTKNYIKISTLEQALETVDFGSVNLPLMIRYKGKITSKIAIEGSIGPSFLILTGKLKKFEGNSNFEAVLQRDANGDYVSYNPNYDLSNPNGSDLILTEQEINHNLFTGDSTYVDPDGAAPQSATTLFNELNAKENFDLGLDVKSSKSGSTTTRYGLGVNAGLDLFYHIKPTIAVKIGFTYAITPYNIGNNGRGGGYAAVKGSADKYYSVFGSRAKSSYTAYGLNIGLIFGL